MLGLKRFTVVLFVVGTATGLRADDQTDATKAPPAAPRVELTFEQMERSMVRIQEQMKDTLRAMVSLQTRARDKKDVIKLNCVNDKLVQAKALMNIADGQSSVLRGSLENRSPDAAAQHAELQETSDRIAKLNEEAVSCMGESELYKQESGSEVEKPEIPDDPTTIDPYANADEIEPPAYASPFS